MPRTNVVGTTAPPGSGAQRCARAGEREHRTDSKTGTAVTTAANRLSHLKSVSPAAASGEALQDFRNNAPRHSETKAALLPIASSFIHSPTSSP
jgi:hypothetical protein